MIVSGQLSLSDTSLTKVIATVLHASLAVTALISTAGRISVQSTASATGQMMTGGVASPTLIISSHVDV
jgi:hypothetical protein